MAVRQKPRPKVKAVPIEEMDARYLECRALGHWWDWRTDERIVVRNGRLIRLTEYSICQRCGKERWMDKDRRFITTRRRYRSPEGYRLRQTSTTKGRSYRQVAVKELLRREGVL